MMLRVLRPSEVTPAMTNWALAILHSSAQLGEKVGPLDFDGVNVLAVVEIHTNGTSTNPAPHPHRGITLYHADSGAPIVPGKWGYVEGVDVSGYQRNVDWHVVKDAGYAFAFIKATDGVTFTSETLADQHAGAGEAGLVRGLYHYFRARDTGKAQVDNLLSAALLHPSELPLVLDVEEADGQSLATVATRVTEAVQALHDAGHRPIIYTMPGFWNQLNCEVDADLWVANWTNATSPALVHGWDEHWMFWQYSSTAEVPGIVGHADVNRFVATLEELRAL